MKRRIQKGGDKMVMEWEEREEKGRGREGMGPQ